MPGVNYFLCMVVIFGSLNHLLQYNLATMDLTLTQEWHVGVENSISRRERNVTELTFLVCTMSDSTRSQPEPLTAAATSLDQFWVSPINEPRLVPPEVFKGNPKQSKPFYLVPLKKLPSAGDLVREVFRLPGLPAGIVLDRAT
ncbi:hypothetical protein AMECASPLE_028211 [Ameca splendens]|uniref:Uncharacterized protein n=1 Tax=Ameca splendens TaxID=208324 RepID=A0ABV1A406_9TELE